MATWKQENIMLTKVGEQALANAEAGEGKITITKVIGSAFTQDDIYNVNSQTQISENITFNIVDKESLEDNVGTSIHIQAVNKNLTAKFRLNTIVVYATHNSIGSGAFPYMIAKAENADEINTPDVTPTTLNYSLTIVNTRGGLLNITLNPAGLVPMSTFVNAKKALEEKIGNDIEAHNTSENAHQNIIDKINSHKNMAELDHPDLSVTTRKLRDKSVTKDKLGEDVLTLLQDTYLPLSGGNINGNLRVKNKNVNALFNGVGFTITDIIDWNKMNKVYGSDMVTYTYKKDGVLLSKQRPNWSSWSNERFNYEFIYFTGRDVYLTEDFTNFDKLIVLTTYGPNFRDTFWRVIGTGLLDYQMEKSYAVNIGLSTLTWNIRGYHYYNDEPSTNVSTKRIFKFVEASALPSQIFGIKY